MTDSLFVRCNNPQAHNQGRILAVLKENTIAIQCKHSRCKRWTKLTVSLPGINIDLSKAAITQEFLPENHHFEGTDAPRVKEAVGV